MYREVILGLLTEKGAVAIVYGEDGKELRSKARGYSRAKITKAEIGDIGLKGQFFIGKATKDWGEVRCLVLPAERVNTLRRQSYDEDKKCAVLDQDYVIEIVAKDKFYLTVHMDLAWPIERDIGALRQKIRDLKLKNTALEYELQLAKDVLEENEIAAGVSKE